MNLIEVQINNFLRKEATDKCLLSFAKFGGANISCSY